VPAELPLLKFDFVLIQRVLINLLENAIKYTEESGIIYIDAALNDQRVAISVSDNGVGLQEEERERIFDKFYRANTGQKIQGVGLGLSISRTIVEAHQGTIFAHESPAGGLTVTFTLPWSPAPMPISSELGM
jgi:two-component system sensor histidine kinase KdpD